MAALSLVVPQLKLEELKSFTSDAHKYDPLIGKLVYIREEVENADGVSEGVWATAKLKSHDENGNFTACMMYDVSIEMQLDAKSLLLVNDHVQNDICKLEHAHEPAIIANIGQRFVQGNFFTAIGPGLIFVNPGDKAYLEDYKISAQYYENYMNKEWNHANAPHIYGLAQMTYDNMCFFNVPQSIIVSGDNGSGKSECVNSIVDYLLYRAYTPADEEDPRSFDHRLRNAFIILESFGCAYATGHENSTRFGLHSKIYFEESNLRSALIEPFLLEKSRVLRAGYEERSFHIFYQLLASKDEPGSFKRYLKHLRLGDAKSFNYLAQEGMQISMDKSNPADTKADAEGFEDLVEAFAILSFSPNQIQSIMQMVASILFLGNIEFLDEKTEDGSGNVVAVAKTPESIQKFANAFAVDVYAANSMLTERKTMVAGKPIVTQMNALDATHTRDWVAKSMYSALFSLITEHINKSLANVNETAPARDIDGKGNDTESYIGVVDLCGLGNHEFNDFEHFLINYANEAVHNCYLSHVFTTQLNMVDTQGFKRKDEWEFAVHDNSACLSMLLGTEKSLGTCLDGVSLGEKDGGSDDIFLQRLTEEKHFDAEHPNFADIPVEIEDVNVFLVLLDVFVVLLELFAD